MLLDGDIVMVAIDRLLGHGEGRQLPGQRLQNQSQHFTAIGHRIILRPVQRFDIIIEMLCALAQIGQIAIR